MSQPDHAFLGLLALGGCLFIWHFIGMVLVRILDTVFLYTNRNSADKFANYPVFAWCWPAVLVYLALYLLMVAIVWLIELFTARYDESWVTDEIVEEDEE